MHQRRGTLVVIRREGDLLFWEMPGSPGHENFELTPVGKDRFFQILGGGRMDFLFHRDASGRVGRPDRRQVRGRPGRLNIGLRIEAVEL